MSNPYPHDVHIYLPNFKPNYVNRERGECEIYRCVMNEEIILYDQIQYVEGRAMDNMQGEGDVRRCGMRDALSIP